MAPGRAASKTSGHAMQGQDDGLPPGRIGWAVSDDGAGYRYGAWTATGDPAGTVVLLPGRGEFLEKYGEVIGDLVARGYDVWCLDWYGQGLSERPLQRRSGDYRGRRKGHIASFARYQAQLAHFLDHIVARGGAAKVLIAHSMGATVALGYLGDRQAGVERPAFDAVVLMAPMLMISLPRGLRLVTRALAAGLTAIGLGRRYAWTQGPHTVSSRFSGNPLTSDPNRFARVMTRLDAQPALLTAGVTWSWLAASFRACDRLRQERLLAAIPEPVLIVSAGADPVVEASAHARAARLLPRAARITIQEARHEIFQERDGVRAQAWAAIDRFLADPGAALAHFASEEASDQP